LNYKISLITLATILFSMSIVAIAHCDPGISVTIIEIDPFITSPSDTATYIVNVESMTEAENVRLTVSDGPGLSFNWTMKEFVLAAGANESFGLQATYSGYVPGDFTFTVSGEAWPTGFSYEEASMIGLIETSDWTDYVYVTPTSIIPEVPLGTIMAGASMIVALLAYMAVPRFRRRKQHPI
jgi:hypothetical protein